MIRLGKILFISLILVIAVGPGLAQDVAPGEGGILIQANTLGDPNFLNPLLANTTTELEVNALMFPNLYDIDPATQLPAPAVENDMTTGMALGWEVSDDGLVYTFTLRDDLFWSDGTPVTSADYKFTFDALASGEVASPRTDVLDTIASVEAPDPQTLIITLSVASCRGLDEMDEFGVLPAHAVQAIIGDDFSAINEMDFNKAPTATSGPFNFAALVEGTQVSLAANPNYIRPVLPEGYILKNVPDKTIALEQLLAGEVNMIGTFDVAQENFAQLRELDAAGEVQAFESIDDGYWWLALNQADPTNPQDGVDEDGNIIVQDPHPLFGNKTVRQAMMMSLNIDEIIDGALNGEGVPALTHASQIAWAYNDNLTPYPFDPDTARTMLEEAGWVDDDGDPSTPLVATEDNEFAEAGTPFSFTVQAQTGDVAVDAATTIMQRQFAEVGIEMNIELLEFGALVGELLGQEFDAIFLNWTNLPTDTDARSQFNPEFDIVGSGFNFVSYQNDDITRLYEEARLVEGCAPEDRIPLYHEAQAILQDDLPYLFIYAPKTMFVVRGNVEGFDPFPEWQKWNISRWTVLGG
ncbi:MAG: hypothetical protein D6737_00490 [Chloroflexi bacterium]|nr:MAG: hypothetical protein CUN54_02840 [Phototrophicales bacterium]RMF82844.1 MAG: hypothetical protein D6737_00490 [Chloroflexota bacterium]